MARNPLRGAMAKMLTCRTCGRDFGSFRRTCRRAYRRRCTAKANKEIARTLRVACKECGKTFSAKARTVRYCSDACRSASARRRDSEYKRRRMADPEKRALMLARTRVVAAARRARERGDEPPRAGRDVKSLKRNAKAAEPRACALCGRDFAPYGGGTHPVHCRRCTAKADRDLGRVVAMACKECGKEFSTRNRIVRYCSRACRADGYRRVVRESARRHMADPEKRARAAARARAYAAAKRAAKKSGGRRSA